MQQQKPLGDGTAIHITIARYYTPSGRSIQNEGITPDVEVLQSKVKVVEKRDSDYSEASFKNSLKNEEAEKKSKKKSSSSKKSRSNDDDDDDDIDEKDLTDEEKDARDYQLQRGISMVIAMTKLNMTVDDRRAVVDAENAEKEKAKEKAKADAAKNKEDKK